MFHFTGDANHPSAEIDMVTARYDDRLVVNVLDGRQIVQIVHWGGQPAKIGQVTHWITAEEAAAEMPLIAKFHRKNGARVRTS